MRSRTSWFNGALFKKNCTRFWPIWAGYALFWAVLFPMMLFNDTTNHQGGEFFTRFANATVLETDALLLTAAVGGILAAMAVFSYLYQSRSAGMFHTLPMRREELFLTNYLSGLAFLAVPTVLSFFTLLAAEALSGYVNAGALCMYLVVHLLVILFFYSFAVFCAMFTGNILALPVFYGILNFVVGVLYSVVHALLQQFLYGYYSVDWLEEAVVWLTPFMRFMGDFSVNSTYAADNTTILSAQFVGLGTALVYALAGVVLAVAALLIYRRRALETAGDLVSVALVRPIFKYGLGACAGLVGGLYLSAMLNIQGGPDSLLGIALWIIPCGIVGYFAAQMLLDKSFRVFSKWKGCVALVGGLALFLGVIYLDPMGFTRWVPDPQQLVSVTVHANSAPYDGWGRMSPDVAYTAPEELALTAELQRALTQQENPNPDQYTENVLLDFELDNGQTVHRGYRYLADEDLLADSTSHAALLTKLLNLPGQEVRYGFPTSDKVQLVDITFPVFDRETGEEISVAVPKEGLEEVYAAVRADLAAGRLGIRYLWDTSERLNNCYYNDLVFGFYAPGGAVDLYPDIPVAELRRSGRWGEKDTQVTITLQATATDTIAALTRLGLLDDDHTLTTYGAHQAWQLSENSRED